MTAERQTVTVEEAAKILGIGRSSAFDAIHRGELPYLRIGKRIVVPVAALERMLLGNVIAEDSEDETPTS